MKWFRFSIVILAATVIGASAVTDVISLTEQRIKPNLLLMLVVYFAINCTSYDAIICSFAIGLAADLTGSLIGPYFLSYGLIGTALTHVRQFVLLKKTGQQAFAIFITSLLIHLVTIIVLQFKTSGSGAPTFSIAAAAGMYSAILWFLLKIPVETLGKWLGVGVYRFGNRLSESRS